MFCKVLSISADGHRTRYAFSCTLDYVMTVDSVAQRADCLCPGFDMAPFMGVRDVTAAIRHLTGEVGPIDILYPVSTAAVERCLAGKQKVHTFSSGFGADVDVGSLLGSIMIHGAYITPSRLTAYRDKHQIMAKDRYGEWLFVEVSLRDIAVAMWEELGGIPVDDDNNLTEAWHCFEAGANVVDVWCWFESALGVSVTADLGLAV